MFGRSRWSIALFGMVSLAGCLSFTPRELELTAQAEDEVASPANPAVIQVTAINRGDSRVTWGPGSSTCQLGLVVRVDGEDVPAGDGRVCTADLSMHSLPPGASRAESLSWSGLAKLGGPQDPPVLLDPGIYELRGYAAPIVMSAPVRVELRAEATTP